MSLEDILSGDNDLAALPQVVMRVIDLTADPKATPADLERVIGSDQALAARLLTLANSSYYGLPRRISSLREAVVFLGFKTLRNMAMTITTFNLFLGRSRHGFPSPPVRLASFGRHRPVRQSAGDASAAAGAGRNRLGSALHLRPAA